MFPTLDPGPSDVKFAVGHWVTVCLNLKTENFQYLDSLFGVKDEAGWTIFNRMVKNICNLWTDCSKGMENPPSPLSVDHFGREYMCVPKQNNG